jgi:diguanylate cyclase (GGDEF)-like protein
MNHDRLLLDLSLELAAAKDNLSAVEAYQRFLDTRFQPQSLKRQDLQDAPTDFPKGEVYRALGETHCFLLPFSIPVIFELTGVKVPPQKEELDTLEKLGRYFAEKLQTISDLRSLTHTDDLTGLFNQRYLELILDREISLAKRNNTEFSVLFLDLDHFKMVNDSHGHLIGSRLLFEVGEEIKRALRDSDITFRYGGDEFVVILSHTGLEAAIMVAERIRVQIEKKRFLARENMDIRLTASIGVANVPLHAGTKKQILKAADEALYGVKKAVRNKVIAATGSFKD